jgi:hypothetical protein
MADILLAVLLFGPLVITYLLKSNAALGFLALCAGVILSDFLSSDVQSMLQHFGYWLDISRTGLVLIILPPVLTLLLARHNLGKPPKSLFQLLAAICLGGLLAIEAMPMLNSINYNYASSALWSDIVKYQSYFAGIGVLTSLLLVWLGGFRSHKKH